MASCDYVDQPLEEVTGISEKCDTSFTVTDPVETQKHVLIEDFSGHKCPNCPSANTEASNIYASTGGRAVIVTIHPDPNIMSSMQNLVGENAPGSGQYETAWYIPEGGEIMDFFSDPGYLPVGMVDRIMNVSFGWRYWDYTEWSNEATARLSEPLDISMAGQAQTVEDGTICGQTRVEYLNAYDGDVRIVHYLTEDSIPDWQLDGTTNIPNYMHRHILRAVSNGQIWGQTVASGNNPAGTETQHFYSFDNFTVVDSSHLHVVSFIYDDATKEVLQAIEFKVD